MISEQKIHAHKANEARKAQLIAFEEEQQWADRTYPSPRTYKKEKITLKQIVKTILMRINPMNFRP